MLLSRHGRGDDGVLPSKPALHNRYKIGRTPL